MTSTSCDQLVTNMRAREEGPTKRKNWSKHDIKHIQAITPMQEKMMRDYTNGDNITASGSAGTGKTFLAIYLALNDMLDMDSEVDKIILVRSAVPTRDLGFTPGTLEEKASLYEAPYQAMFADIMGRRNTYQDMKEALKVEFQTTSYIRGVTWDNAVVIVDECQSMTFHEINTIMTRLGSNSRIIMCGDLPQTDLRKRHEVTGMGTMLAVTARIEGFSNITFTRDDIVRSNFVKEWIIAAEDVGAA